MPLSTPPLSLSPSWESPLAVDSAATMSCKMGTHAGEVRQPGANLWHSNKRQLTVTVAEESMRTTLMVLVLVLARLPKCLLNKRKLMMRKKRR